MLLCWMACTAKTTVTGKTPRATTAMGVESVPEIPGYRRFHREKDNAPFIRSIPHVPDQTGVRSQLLHGLLNLTTPNLSGLLPNSERFS